ncbi:phosphate signaling complex protein PhoU [Clostridium celatum]|uniref:Phosphate-specific transport system accessory protein PhoU n=1 Tax=Clostridium celatum DSM 1785 TaxID=545697 RepID=L1QF74_9CLOT|nr:phosphate signaling complex protein PhoU [Clostridium celatum]EKY26649.1 phosphate transport system regulatory protein PhoU [Clostridium celatum DSM 1785]MCE9653807.1 phosphate signaling complex protein PhoU [Clostridium celatum]MDU3722554.1 phosphate signaling complex protein PhoU [Clostridium celatum]MDU6295696.1 phosphate signaling complex protein PhoU [Clostridium celatum]MDY3360545.1 phosphate signaling complex protein PhoU [Clostridium celatum]
MTRNLLDKRMKILTAELAEMGSLVEKQIYNSIEAFRNKDMALAKQVMDNDDKVDELNRKIEEQCLKFMAMESPVATDLRKIFTTSKIVTDLERMADYAVDICKIAQRVEFDILGEECEPIWQMVDILRKMINKSLSAFVAGDVKAAYEICKMDDQVDILYRGLFSDMLKKMAKDETIINKGAQILFASKYLERVGDHVTNICEWIIFSAKGDYVDLNE